MFAVVRMLFRHLQGMHTRRYFDVGHHEARWAQHKGCLKCGPPRSRVRGILDQPPKQPTRAYLSTPYPVDGIGCCTFATNKRRFWLALLGRISRLVWSVAVTVPQAERRASSELEVAGVTSYFPKLATIEAHRGRIVERRRPLFPGYLFWYFNEAAWSVVKHAEHVLDVLMGEALPALLRDEIVDELRDRESDDGVIHVDPPKRKRKFGYGMCVRINEHRSAFFGLSGIVSGMSGEQRVEVLMDLLGRMTPVTVRETELVLA